MSSSKKEIVSLLSNIERDGINNLIKFLKESTFFEDPASCQDHNPYRGGLADHSLNTYKLLNSLIRKHATVSEDKVFTDSIKIIGLLHDINKIGTFQKVMKNVPLKGPDGKNRKKENGRLIFIEKESYEPLPKNNLPYLPGHLSTIMLKEYIKLTKLEDLSIYWADALSQDYVDKHLLFRAQKINRVILFTQFAKKEAKLFQNITI